MGERRRSNGGYRRRGGVAGTCLVSAFMLSWGATSASADGPAPRTLECKDTPLSSFGGSPSDATPLLLERDGGLQANGAERGFMLEDRFFSYGTPNADDPFLWVLRDDVLLACGTAKKNTAYDFSGHLAVGPSDTLTVLIYAPPTGSAEQSRSKKVDQAAVDRVLERRRARMEAAARARGQQCVLGALEGLDAITAHPVAMQQAAQSVAEAIAELRSMLGGGARDGLGAIDASLASVKGELLAHPDVKGTDFAKALSPHVDGLQSVASALRGTLAAAAVKTETKKLDDADALFKKDAPLHGIAESGPAALERIEAAITVCEQDEDAHVSAGAQEAERAARADLEAISDGLDLPTHGEAIGPAQKRVKERAQRVEDEASERHEACEADWELQLALAYTTDWGGDVCQPRRTKCPRVKMRHRWHSTFKLPVVLRENVVVVPFGGGARPTAFLPSVGERVTLLVTDVPRGTTVTPMHGEERLETELLSGDAASILISTLVDAALPKGLGLESVTEVPKKKGDPICPRAITRTHRPGTRPVLGASVVTIDVPGIEPGKGAKLSLCEGEACADGDARAIKTSVRFREASRWGGFALLLDLGVNLGADAAYGPPSYRALGDPVGGQQTYRLDYPGLGRNLMSASVLVGGRFGTHHDNRAVFLGAGPALVPMESGTVLLQLDARLGLRVYEGTYVTLGVGARSVRAPRVAEIGEIRTTAVGADPPRLTDTERSWQPVVGIGVAIDLGVVGEGAVKLLNAATDRNGEEGGE